MKLEKFHEICVSKWNDGRGDVQELWLREDSFDEFWKDTLISRSRPVSLVSMTVLLNPLTRSEVRVRITKGPHDFVVAYFRGGRKETDDIPDP